MTSQRPCHKNTKADTCTTRERACAFDGQHEYTAQAAHAHVLPHVTPTWFHSLTDSLTHSLTHPLCTLGKSTAAGSTRGHRARAIGLLWATPGNAPPPGARDFSPTGLYLPDRNPFRQRLVREKLEKKQNQTPRNHQNPPEPPQNPIEPPRNPKRERDRQTLDDSRWVRYSSCYKKLPAFNQDSEPPRSQPTS